MKEIKIDFGIFIALIFTEIESLSKQWQSSVKHSVTNDIFI